jgi:hypothetical protein
VRNIFYVSNVGQQADLCLLEDLFLTVGDVKAQHLELIPESGHRMEFGIFEMSTEQQAADCVERFNGHIFNGRSLVLVLDRPKTRPVPKRRHSK